MRCFSPAPAPDLYPVRTGFTLMELLVVISIIMLLMGMLFAGIRLAKDAAARAKTQSVISHLVAACENYRQVNGRYPEGTVANPPILPHGFNDSQAFGTGTYDQPFSAFEAKWEYINGALVDALNSAGESLKFPVVDAWKKPIQYRPAKYYPYLPTVSNKRIDGEDPPNRDSFQMWSIGKNTTDEAGEINTDDVTSWTK